MVKKARRRGCANSGGLVTSSWEGGSPRLCAPTPPSTTLEEGWKGPGSSDPGPPQPFQQGPSSYNSAGPSPSQSPHYPPPIPSQPPSTPTPTTPNCQPHYALSPVPSAGPTTPGPGGGTFPPANYNGPLSLSQGPPFGSVVPPQFQGRTTSVGPGPYHPQFVGGPPTSQGYGSPTYGLPPSNSPYGAPPGVGPISGPGHVPPGHPMTGIMGPGPIDQGSLPIPRRHNAYFGQPDYRVYELNKRLQQREIAAPIEQESDNLWWEGFANEFFEDDATLTLTFCLEDGPKRYTIGRTLIPRYFRSIFEGGVTELYYNLKHPKESFHNTSITLDCDQCTMITHHGKPVFSKVCTEGRLILEFTFDDLMRVKSWHFAVRTHRELIPRSVVAMHTQQDPTLVEQLSKNITRQGITNSTLNYLRLCVILEPMQELMSRFKAYALSPRDCLKTTLFQKWQRMVAPPESQRPQSKRRKRKGSQSGAANSTPPAPNKKRSPGPNFSLASQDVMVVGEPSLMGGEFGDEDERLITRLENTQYDASSSLADENNFSDSPMTSGTNSWGAGSGGDRSVGTAQGNTPTSQDSDKKSPAVSQ